MQIELNDIRFPTWPVAAVVFIVRMIILWRRKHNLSYLICFAIFSFYLALAADKVFFPIAISGTYADTMRLQAPFSAFINLAPFNFNFSLSEMPDLVILQIVQNILLTIPFGFGVSFVVRLKPKDFLWLVPAVGLGTELLQLIIGLILRYPYRTIDINDAILNALGVLIGYVVFRIFARLYLWMTQRFAINLRGLAAYIAVVASQAIDNAAIIS